MKSGVNAPGYNNALDELTRRVLAARSSISLDRALLVGISGIDGSGKGFIAAKLADALRAKSLGVALISADDWLNLPHVCINPDHPGEHFYNHALRLKEMFERLIGPLRDQRQVDVLADCGDAKATVHRKHRYVFRNIDVVLLEGIFLFKPGYREYFDLKIWIECSFQTALGRAIARGQEGLPPAETQQAFETIYFPAQRIHFDHDDPRGVADFILHNDDS
jgi:uridine kinase